MTAVLRIVAQVPWLMDALRLVANVEPTAWIGAGAVRNVVWDTLHGIEPAPPEDIDVVFFRPANSLSETELAAQLSARCPNMRWDVVNQAHVHRWLSAKLRRPVPPYPTLAHAIRSWPETATAVAVRLHADDRLEILAPFGESDILDLVLRHSNDCPDPTAFEQRLKDKRFVLRWPKLQVAQCSNR